MGRPAVLLALCAVLGLGTVVWRGSRSESKRVSIQGEVQASALALEAQFKLGVVTVETLGALARQSGGGIPNFQKTATDLLAAVPSLAWIELQPGGVVSDIVPRAGHERFIGFNVLNDVVQRPGANQSIQTHNCTVSGPLALYDGTPGIVIREPVFHRGRDGREVFWGFVSVSMRLSEAQVAARTDNLWISGCDYALYSVGLGGQKSPPLTTRGNVTLGQAVEQTVPVCNIDLVLAAQPQGGWFDLKKTSLEFLVVLAFTGLVGLLVNSLKSRLALEATIGDQTRRIMRETSDRKQAQEELQGEKHVLAIVQSELKQARSALEVAQADLTEAQGCLESTGQNAADTAQNLKAFETKVSEAESKAAKLQDQLDAATIAAREAQEAARVQNWGVDKTDAALQQAVKTISDLQAQFEAEARARKAVEATANARAQQDQASIAALESRLVELMRTSGETPEPNVPEPTAEEKRELENEARLVEHTASLSDPELMEPQLDPLVVVLPDALRPEPLSTTPATPAAQLDPVEVVDAPAVIEASSVQTVESDESKTTAKPPAKRRKARGDDQMNLLSDLPAVSDGAPKVEAVAQTPVQELLLISELTANAMAEMGKRGKVQPEVLSEVLPRRASRANVAPLRKAANQIVPLLTDGDPGAKDCLEDNRAVFLSAFGPEAFEEFERLVNDGNYRVALEQLKKTARKHLVSV